MNIKVLSGVLVGLVLSFFIFALGYLVNVEKILPSTHQESIVLGEKNQASLKKDCVTIQDGELLYSPGHYLEGTPLPIGYDEYGYNYQAHMFKGSYANVYLGRSGFPPYKGDSDGYLSENPGAEGQWYWPYRDDELIMKWNNDWLSNSDCIGDGLLDRHFGSDTYIGSGAWETNHQSGTYLGDDGKTCKWNYFVKIIAVPGDATATDGFWYTSNGAEIGSVIWGAFAIVQEVYNDPCGGAHGVDYHSPAGPGFGKWK